MTTKMEERNCTVQFRGNHNVARITLLVRIAQVAFNPLNAKLNPICCLLALLGAHHFLHVNRI